MLESLFDLREIIGLTVVTYQAGFYTMPIAGWSTVQSFLDLWANEKAGK